MITCRGSNDNDGLMHGPRIARIDDANLPHGDIARCTRLVARLLLASSVLIDDYETNYAMCLRRASSEPTTVSVHRVVTHAHCHGDRSHAVYASCLPKPPCTLVAIAIEILATKGAAPDKQNIHTPKWPLNAIACTT